MLILAERQLGPEPTPFGREMRLRHFDFASSYRPFNHGSFGTFPKAVRQYQQFLQQQAQERPDTFRRIAYPELLREARGAVAPLLGAHVDEVVLVPNASTAFNTVVRNLVYEDGDVILYFSTVYSSFLRTIQSLEETTAVQGHSISLVYPIEDDEVLNLFEKAIIDVQTQGKRVKLASFDTVLTFPGVRFPWERMLAKCREFGVMSCVDGAHGIGHISLYHMAGLGPDFFISNCYKWIMVPQGCSALYVPFRNQHLIKTTFPTSEDFLPERERRGMPVTDYFVNLFNRVGTIDFTPYLCISEALRFRSEVCGGEEQVREYGSRIAREGGMLMAQIMGTEVLENKTKTLCRCCFTNVRLPLTSEEAGCPQEAVATANWISEKSIIEYDSYLPTRYYNGAFWTRLSGQIYLEHADFEWAAHTLIELCNRARQELALRGV
ncbi:aminotransferase family protein-like protein [Pseudomassariella vexata]|uniref:Aminotransferase family protein-like protein n=1 Tax=Pseudomassariella vexata TaxID=1141098 RepID=A0A1Y2DPK2_9PEZI|nr:aminotransferase family protein-like protein [Pseudomassariella vexata]ORY61212.1 aminotransferase family protein-like protein [Pseudomassariella vexata]